MGIAGVPVQHGRRPECSSVHRDPLGRLDGMKHCKGDLCPHSPAVARGRRATSPVGPKPIASYLAFSGIAASPP